MATNTVGMMYLGRMVDFDPDENNISSENADAALGIYHGAEQLSLVNVTNHDLDDSGSISDDDRPTVDGDARAETTDFTTYSIDGIDYTQKADSSVLYNARVIEGDGTVSNMQIAVVQMQNGDTFALDLENQGLLDSMSIQSIELTSVENSRYTGYYTNQSIQNSLVVCFLSHTKIATPDGPRPIREIRAGEAVTTLDHGPLRVIWTGRCPAQGAEVVEIAPGALGSGLPVRMLSVSRQHRLLSSGSICRRMFGKSEILLPAHRLTCLEGIRSRRGREGETYIHLLLDRHAIILAEDAPAESLLPGAMAMKALPYLSRRNMLRRLEDCGLNFSDYKAARPIPRGSRVPAYLERLTKEARPFVEHVRIEA